MPPFLAADRREDRGDFERMFLFTVIRWVPLREYRISISNNINKTTLNVASVSFNQIKLGAKYF